MKQFITIIALFVSMACNAQIRFGSSNTRTKFFYDGVRHSAYVQVDSLITLGFEPKTQEAMESVRQLLAPKVNYQRNTLANLYKYSLDNNCTKVIKLDDVFNFQDSKLKDTEKFVNTIKSFIEKGIVSAKTIDGERYIILSDNTSYETWEERHEKELREREIQAEKEKQERLEKLNNTLDDLFKE